MPTLREALVQAVAAHQAGRLPEAERIYREVLKADARCADAWHLLGVLASQTGGHERAVEYILKAIEIDDQQAVFYVGTSAAYQKASLQAEDGVACFRRALELKPEYPEALNNLGVACLQNRGQPAEAEECFRRVLGQNPNYAEAQHNLGNSLHVLGRPAEALACPRGGACG